MNKKVITEINQVCGYCGSENETEIINGKHYCDYCCNLTKPIKEIYIVHEDGTIEK